MTQDHPQQRSSNQAASQNEQKQNAQDRGAHDQDPLTELKAKEPALHTAKHRHPQPMDEDRATDQTDGATAKETDTLRGHDTPQSVRHAG